ncbi:hemolysin XhlA family protein [Actinoallomurus purpureus]|uniref:hemolysin XhlA family protein n=1 Tax=Actinoallomurus purpureus TaxID=478114 RepID=UPI00209370E3|nr:hemolysin XhlA family protein [Actinoallomurus purpureus]MCO6006036.1 hemolysin XhlA family protein [Actinoallomurus purpureus]
MLVSNLEERVSALEKDVQVLRMASHGWAEVALGADRKVGGVSELLNLIYREIAAIKETLARHEERFTAIETRLDRVETRLEKVETRLEGMDSKLDLILDRLAA